MLDGMRSKGDQKTSKEQHIVIMIIKIYMEIPHIIDQTALDNLTV